MSGVGDIANDLPKYCDFFKHLLVEELALEPDYRQIHYGKCAVIGRLSAVPQYFKLENVTIPHLPNAHSLSIGAVSLLLLNFTYENTIAEQLAHGCYCIARGEAVLCNVQEPNSPSLTTRGLHEQLLQLENNKEAKSKLLEQLQLTHRPALYVWHTNRIDHAEELIQRRLEMRVLCKKRQ